MCSLFASCIFIWTNKDDDDDDDDVGPANDDVSNQRQIHNFSVTHFFTILLLRSPDLSVTVRFVKLDRLIQANSASYPQRDGKWVVATATGRRPSVADWGDGVSASCIVGPIVR